MSLSQHVYNAIISKLRSDSGTGGLVSLLGHSNNDLRIGRYFPRVAAKDPFLSVRLSGIRPLAEDSFAQVYEARGFFLASSSSELKVLKINDRLAELFFKNREATGTPGNREYYDFSDSNICARNLIWETQNSTEYDEDENYYLGITRGTLIWSES